MNAEEKAKYEEACIQEYIDELKECSQHEIEGKYLALLKYGDARKGILRKYCSKAILLQTSLTYREDQEKAIAKYLYSVR